MIPRPMDIANRPRRTTPTIGPPRIARDFLFERLIDVQLIGDPPHATSFQQHPPRHKQTQRRSYRPSPKETNRSMQLQPYWRITRSSGYLLFLVRVCKLQDSGITPQIS